jgi:GNAT superfamily N-acetyltransferase
MNFKIKNRLPTAAEYAALRQSVEWPAIEPHLVELALANSLHAVVAEDDNGVAVGMGRIVGDNAVYLHLQDVIVHPRHQLKGVGRLIMNDLMAYVERTGGKNTNVGLMSSKGREGFYRSFGFIERPSEKFGSGMIMIKE